MKGSIPPLETSVHRQNEIRLIALTDPRAARAEELRDLGLDRLARKIEACGQPSTLIRYCHERICPSCARWAEVQRQQRIFELIREMRTPVFVTIALRSETFDGLSAGIADWTRLMGKLRQLPIWREFVRSGCGGREWKPTNDGRAWNVHAHLALDVADDSDPVLAKWIAEADAEWKRLTAGQGTVTFDPARPRISVDQPDRLAAYAGKARDIAPPPGVLTPAALAVLVSASRGVRLVVHWGGRRPRRAQAVGCDHMVAFSSDFGTLH